MSTAEKNDLNEEDLGSAYKTYVGGVKNEVEANKQAITDAYNALEIQAQDKLNADKTAAQNAYERSLSTYGAQAEALRSRGFTTGQQGGYSTFLDASANMTRQKAITDLDKAYQSLIADLGVKKSNELRTEDAKVTTAEATYNTNKLNAYNGILNNAGMGAYQSQGGVDNDISAYESFYGKMGEDQRTSIQKAYETTLAESGEVGSEIINNMSDPTIKQEVITNYTNKIKSTMSNIVDDFVGGENASAGRDIVDLLKDIKQITSDGEKTTVINSFKDAFVSSAKEKLKDPENATSIWELCNKVAEELGTDGTTLKDSVLNEIYDSLPNDGTGFAFLGGSKDAQWWNDTWNAYNNDPNQALNTDDTKIKFNGEAYTIKVKLTDQVDTNTSNLLNSLVDSRVKNSDGYTDVKVGGYAVAYNGKIYFYDIDRAVWLNVKRTSSELDDLKHLEKGYVETKGYQGKDS